MRADVRMPVGRADGPFAVAVVATGVLLLYSGRSLTFWFDEWRSIAFQGTVVDLFRPVNEHWQTFPLILYRSTFELVGLHSYLPYLAQVILLHLVAVAGAYVLMRRRVGPFTATLLCLPLLLVGVGAENLFWAFQTGFVGSVAFGVWSLGLIEQPGRRMAIAASVLLIVSLTASGIGLFFLVAVAGRAAAERVHRRRLAAVVAPSLVYLAWYALLGRDAIGSAGDLAKPVAVVRFTLCGIGHSIEAMGGLDRLGAGGLVGPALFAILGAIALRRAHRGQAQGLAIGCLLGLVAMYVVIGIARAELDSDYSTRGRYVYVAAFFLMLCIADLLAGKDVSVRAPGIRHRPLAVLAAGIALSWVLAVNIHALFTVRTQFQYQSDLTRAIIDLSIRHEGEPWLDPDAGLDLMPPAGALPAVVERYGSPLEDAYFPSVVSEPSDDAYEYARRILSRDE